MLYLVGLGIWDEGDITLKGIQVCKKSGKVYAELYTSAWGGDLKKLEKVIGKGIKVVQRSDMEENASRLVKEAKKRDIAILVPGDPLSATTHSGIMDEAMKSNVRVEVVHSSSVFTAVAETGLSLYNFGKTITVVAPGKKYRPDSFYETIRENIGKGMHTLLLLDIDMSVQEGLNVLMEIEGKKQKKVLTDKTDVIVASAIGSPEKLIKYGNVLELAGQDFPPPAVIIIPGRLNFFEREFLEKL
jgi:diphthine synthase